jgi:hypothetical protein
VTAARPASRRHPLRLVGRLAAAAALSLAGCAEIGLAPGERDAEAVRVGPGETSEPERVEVQHVLISFAGAELPGVTRSLAKAEEMAERVLAAAEAGRPFDELMHLYSDDGGGTGTYKLLNWGVARLDPNELDRGRMVRDFHRKAFRLGLGEIALVRYDATGSPLGFHVMKRLR